MAVIKSFNKAQPESKIALPLSDDSTESRKGRKLKQWIGMAWSNDAIMPSDMYRSKGRKQTMIRAIKREDGRTDYKAFNMRIVETNLFICLFSNVANINSLAQQRNLLDRGHEVPIKVEVDNLHFKKLWIRASYHFENEYEKLPKNQWGSLFSYKYAVRLTFPIVSDPDRNPFITGTKIKIEVG